MILPGTLSIFCMLMAAPIQARVIIIDDIGDQNIEKQSFQRCISNSPAENFSHPFPENKEVLLASQPEINSGKFINILHLIYKKIGIFPNGFHDSRRILIRNVRSGKCVTVKGDSDGFVTKGIEANCKESHLVHLDHVGDGYVTLRMSTNFCIAAGFDPWSYVYIYPCKISPSNQWAIVQKGNHVVFKQRESKRCLTSRPNYEELFVGNNDCEKDDPNQQYHICDKTETKCWPPNAE